MFRKILLFVGIVVLLFSLNGCALLGPALSAAAAYGIYQATRK